jgi:DNA-binding GntR family transcriptional regulator
MNETVKSIPAGERVYRWLRERILDGSIAGGQMVTEGEISEAVDVSRTPVREALLQLAAEGVLELYPKRGALVLAVSAAELREVLIARALIEPWAARAVAGRGDRTRVSEAMREATAAARAALNAEDARAFQDADLDFHRRLLSAAGNRLLAGFYGSLRDRELRAGMFAVFSDPVRSKIGMVQHDAIADAVERGDGEAAAAAMVEHLDGTALALGQAPLSSG